MVDLSRKRDRDRLTARREPYWQRLDAGAYLGFRRGPNRWLARFRGRDKKQQYQALGEAFEFDEAKKRAEDWLSLLAGCSVRAVKRDTVISALTAYLAHLRRHDRADAANRADGCFKTAFAYGAKTRRYSDPLAEMQVEEATNDDFLAWRDRLRPGRLARTVNRMVRAVSAGLNRAKRLGYVGDREAWRFDALPDDGEHETAVFLAPIQRRGLMDAASSDAAAFLQGLEHTGARPKELTTATVGDFDGQHIKLSHRKGRPPKLRSRYVVLDTEGVAFFTAQAHGKCPSAYIFMDDGKPWSRGRWATEIRSAISTHNQTAATKAVVPIKASAYSFRHARISELLQVYGVDPLTVAAQTGTSLRMIERSYFRFIRSALLEKLARLKTRPVAASAAPDEG